MKTEVKICKKCKFHTFNTISYCTRNPKIDMISGIKRYRECENQRIGDWFYARFTGNCGEAGRFYEENVDESI